MLQKVFPGEKLTRIPYQNESIALKSYDYEAANCIASQGHGLR